MLQSFFLNRSLLKSALCAAAVVVSPAAFAAPGEIENLGTLFGSQPSQALDINDAGDVVGHARVLRNGTLIPHAFARPAGGGPIVDLTPDIGVSQAHAVNAAGLIVGWGDLPVPPQTMSFERAFIRPATGGEVQIAGVNDGILSRAYAINQAGDIAGNIGRYVDSVLQERPFIRLSDGTVRDLGIPAGASHASARGINDARDVVGTVEYAGLDLRAFVYREAGGEFEELGTLGGRWSNATDINNAGDIVGVSEDGAGAGWAFVRPGDALIRVLPKLAGSLGSGANDINEAGFVVGSVAVGVNHAAFWHTDGTITDLDAWLDQVNPLTGQFWTLNSASAINNLGIIVGSGTYNDGAGGLSDGTRGFVLDASSLLVPEPTSLAVVLVPAVLATRRRANRDSTSET